MKALVTGGGGFLGKAIVSRLLEKGVEVTSISRGFYPELDEMGVTQIQGSIGHVPDVEKAVQGMDVVFHVAAKPGVWGRYEAYYHTNVTGTVNITDACLKFKIPSLIHTSSPSVVFDGNDMEGANESVPYPKTLHTPYTKTKKIAEEYVGDAAKKGLKTIILRPHLIWGPGDNHLVPRVLERAEKLARVGKANKRVDTIYIDNAAHAHILAAEKLRSNPELSGNIYFISQDEPIPMWDMINGILKAGGKQSVTRWLPRRMVWTAGALLELIYTTFRLEGEPPMTRFVADELATAHWFDISAAKRDLGYQPLVSINEGLKNLSEWLTRKT